MNSYLLQFLLQYYEYVIFIRRLVYYEMEVSSAGVKNTLCIYNLNYNRCECLVVFDRAHFNDYLNENYYKSHNLFCF